MASQGQERKSEFPVPGGMQAEGVVLVDRLERGPVHLFCTIKSMLIEETETIGVV